MNGTLPDLSALPEKIENITEKVNSTREKIQDVKANLTARVDEARSDLNATVT